MHAAADGAQKFLAELIVIFETTGKGLGVNPFTPRLSSPSNRLRGRNALRYCAVRTAPSISRSNTSGGTGWLNR